MHLKSNNHDKCAESLFQRNLNIKAFFQREINWIQYVTLQVIVCMKTWLLPLTLHQHCEVHIWF